MQINSSNFFFCVVWLSVRDFLQNLQINIIPILSVFIESVTKMHHKPCRNIGGGSLFEEYRMQWASTYFCSENVAIANEIKR